MVAVKAHQANAFLKNMDPKITSYLFYGTDAGLISERAQTAAQNLAKIQDPEGEVLRLDDADMESGSERLEVELRTMPMFGGRKIVRVTTGRRINTAMLKPLADDNSLAGVLIVEAGNLKPTDALRKLFEKSAHTAAIACFPDETRDISQIIDEALSQAGLAIEPHARDLLVSRLGADRALSRGEIEKLSIFAMGKERIDVDDVEAIVGDASEQAIDRVLSATASGRTAPALQEFARTLSSGENAQTVIAATHRYFQRLHFVRSELDQGRMIADALRKLRPPIHFKQKDAFSAQARSWSIDALQRALGMISAAAKRARRNAGQEDVIAERLLLELARLATRIAPARGR